MRRMIVPLVCLGALTLLTACHVVDRGRYSSSTGKQLSGREVNSITIGQTTGDELIQWFGAPSSRSDRPDGTSTWKWCESRTETSSGHVLFLWDRDSSHTTTRCTSVELRSGVVASVHNE